MLVKFDINHSPILDVGWLAEHYTKKDGVPVKYVCTSALGDEAFAGDIFYRDTPHPEFGNKYFQIYNQPLLGPYIRSADKIEDLYFVMLDTPSGYHYSRHRHDFFTVDGMSIDGGRTYTRTLGFNVKTKTFRVKKWGVCSMRTVTQKWALVGQGFQRNFDTKTQIMLVLANQSFLDQFPEDYEFCIIPVYVVVEGKPLQLEYYK